MEPRRIDLDALLTAHAFMRVERPPELWQVDVEDEPFIRMLGEMIVVGLLHHDVLADLTLNASNVTVGDDGPDGVAPGDYVAMTVRGPGAWERDITWTPTSAGRSGTPTSTLPPGPRPSPSATCAAPARRRDPSPCSSLDRSRRKDLRTHPSESSRADVDIVERRPGREGMWPKVARSRGV